MKSVCPEQVPHSFKIRRNFPFCFYLIFPSQSVVHTIHRYTIQAMIQKDDLELRNSVLTLHLTSHQIFMDTRSLRSKSPPTTAANNR